MDIHEFSIKMHVDLHVIFIHLSTSSTVAYSEEAWTGAQVSGTSALYKRICVILYMVTGSPTPATNNCHPSPPPSLNNDSIIKVQFLVNVF